MGVDYNCYVGPYIQVHNPPVASTEEYHTCPNDLCRNHKRRLSQKFCELCGDEIKLVAFPCQAPKDFDLYGECNEKLYEAMTEYGKSGDLKDEMIILSNVRGTPGFRFDPEESYFAKELTAASSAEQIAEFSRIFAPELDKIIATFGADNVKVKWGVLAWAS